MVAAVENLTRVRGTIVDRVPHPQLPGWDTVTVAVSSAHSVPGKADLVSARLSARAVEPLQIAVRRDLLGDAAPGAELTARVKLAQAQLIAESYPEEGDFVVSQARAP